MTSNKSFKSRVRTRMAKTGESYSAARRNLVPRPGAPGVPAVASETDPGVPAAVPASGEPGNLAGEAAVLAAGVPADLASEAAVPPAGPAEEAAAASHEETVSGDAMAAATGRSRGDWFALLDGWGAVDRSHGEIARWLVEEHGVAGWWAQSVTVAYEQARGLRLPGQRRGGDFSVGASKTVAVPAERVTAAFTDEALRARWLPEAPFRVRTARPGRSVTADWEGRAAVTVHLVAKGPDRTQISLQHGKLPDAGSAAAMKAFWRERVTVLKQVLEG
ncbi:hypothetical protein Ppa06_51590 [Planomonospora parontospora subsp. parontospora]|uniref:SRPBCC domain-containing protein n=2 Tax=Planomonospora parontospora TaxID=58119 RepID=A0AA37BJI3_9ACTN|nr:hypothetical protein [Planomonospora parontospora]GGK80661.1 hypothetical protein GCM10010126_44980 [Planomonospora parontospora]GII11361.1 hypothetical protein Ppa06_51590 [Planomonospora parontospora subsp. parontospora]